MTALRNIWPGDMPAMLRTITADARRTGHDDRHAHRAASRRALSCPTGAVRSRSNGREQVRHRASRLERLSIVVQRWAWRIRAFGRPVTCAPWRRERRWPSGDYDEIAEIALTDAAIEIRLGRPLLRGVQEGLGPWRADGFRLSTGEVMELIFYEFYQGQCYCLRVDRGTPIDAAIAHFLEAFDLDETCVRWRFGSARQR
jgi:hypothetical protein